MYPMTSGVLIEDTQEHRDLFSHTDNFEEEYDSFLEVNGGIMVPRNQVDSDIVDDQRDEGLPIEISVNPNFKPRNPEQEYFMKESSELLENGESFIGVAPTGSGKTILGVYAITVVKRRTMIVCTKSDLLKQWHEAIKIVTNYGDDDIGLLRGDIVDVDKPIVLALVQSVSKLDRYPPEVLSGFGFCLVDEVHVIGAETFVNVMFTSTAKLRMGLSATPKRQDGRTHLLYDHIGEMGVEIKSLPMTPKVIVVEHENRKIRHVPIKNGRQERVNKALIADNGRNALFVDFIITAFRKGRKILFMSHQTKHLDVILKKVSKEIGEDNIGMYIGGMKQEELDEAKTKSLILTTYKMCDYGTDMPDVDVVVFGTPKANIAQSAGRGLRLVEGKKQPILFDVVDTEHYMLDNYFLKRLKWYASVGASIVRR